MLYKLAPIILNSQQKTSLASEIFISQPDSSKESLAGKAFILVEINSHKSDAVKILNFIINRFNESYYNDEKILLRERISSLKIEHIFESVLTKLNKELEDLIEKNKLRLNLKDINIIIGVVNENNLHFTYSGNVRAIIIFKDTDQKPNSQNSEGNYKVASIINSQDEIKEKNEEGKKKLFSSVINGKIPKKGYVLFSNEALPEYLSQRQLIDIVTKLSPTGAAEQIKNTLSGINAYVSFLGIIIKNTTAQNSASEPIKKTFYPEEAKRHAIDAQKSLTSLQTTEEKTERLLAPSGIINLKSWIGALKTLGEKLPKSIRPAKRFGVIPIKDKILVSKKPNPLSWKKLLDFIKNVISLLSYLTLYIIRAITSKERFLVFINETKFFFLRCLKKILRIKPWFIGLQKKHKILIFCLTAIMIFFVFSLIFADSGNKKQGVAQTAKETIEKIKQKQNQIDANLLYSNESRAKEILKEVGEMIGQLPDGYTAEQEELSAKHNSQMEKIQHFIILEDLSQIADFANLNSQAEAANLILVNNKLYSGDSKNKTIYSFDLSENIATAIVDINNTLNKLERPAIVNSNLIFYANGNEITILNTADDSVKNITIAYPEGLNSVAMASYGNRLYFLDENQNKIYRYSFSNEGLSTPSNWLNGSPDLSEAKNMAIDGNLYVLKANGEIMNFFSGDQIDFKNEIIEPPLSSATKIITMPDWENIYLLEPVSKRIAIFDKKGNFVVQYKSEKLDNIRDFVIDEQNKIIYILNGNLLYKASLLHNQ